VNILNDLLGVAFDGKARTGIEFADDVAGTVPENVYGDDVGGEDDGIGCETYKAISCSQFAPSRISERLEARSGGMVPSNIRSSAFFDLFS
jgi:hypothetical protein